MKAYALAIAALALTAGGWALGVGQQEGFPHRRHEGLFPLCESCHDGILSGDASQRFPTPARCASCHDGQELDRVAWSGRTPRASLLRFDHRTHTGRLEATGESAECQTCHGTNPRVRMAVAGPRAESCLTCHAHAAQEHLSPGRDCAVCHVPLTRATSMPSDRIAAFPRPASHDQPGFGAAHAPGTPIDQTACATCHARESCARCHLNAETVPAIAALQPDGRVAGLVHGIAPEYPLPATHRSGTWSVTHGADASAAPGACANCHAQASCRSCHREGTLPAVAALPVAAAGDPRGVAVAAASRVHAPMFATTHAADGAARDATCSSCHATQFCESCHTGPKTPQFHGNNFLARHASEAYANEQDCASCHNAEVFCRACHSGMGLASQGRTAIGFHTSNPAWIIGHGQAARQGMDGCITCHSQATCTQCHSAKSGWRISPHGPGFDPIRMRNGNQLMCRRCHLSGDIFK